MTKLYLNITRVKVYEDVREVDDRIKLWIEGYAFPLKINVLKGTARTWIEKYLPQLRSYTLDIFNPPEVAVKTVEIKGGYDMGIKEFDELQEEQRETGYYSAYVSNKQIFSPERDRPKTTNFGILKWEDDEKFPGTTRVCIGKPIAKYCRIKKDEAIAKAEAVKKVVESLNSGEITEDEIPQKVSSLIKHKT